jgi:hypothetical protein
MFSSFGLPCDLAHVRFTTASIYETVHAETGGFDSIVAVAVSLYPYLSTLHRSESRIGPSGKMAHSQWFFTHCRRRMSTGMTQLFHA